MDHSLFFLSSGNPWFCFHFRKMLADLAHVYFLHKANVCSSPPPSFGSNHFSEFKLDHAWCLYPVPFVLSTVQYILNLMAGTSESQCHQDLLIWHMGTHWLTEYSSSTTEPEKLGLTKSLPFPARMWHLIFCFGQKLTILVFCIMTVLTPQAKTTTIRSVLDTKYFHTDYTVRYQGNDSWGALWTVWLG